MPAPGKYGRQPRDLSRPVPKFEDYLIAGAATTTVPYVPYNEDVDYGQHVPSWPMYCNGPDEANAACCPGSPEGCGDCTCAYWGHAVQAWSLYLTGAEVVVPPKNIIAMYSAISGYEPNTGANDNGCQLLDVLQYMKEVGLPDSTGKLHKVAGWALLPSQSQELLAQALDLGGTVYLAAQLQQAQEDQFGAGQPWDYVAGSPEAGGHAFGLQRRAPVGLHKLRLTTWGQLWPATTPFYDECVDEAYYVVSQDDIAANGLSRAGYNLEQLLADMPRF